MPGFGGAHDAAHRPPLPLLPPASRPRSGPLHGNGPCPGGYPLNRRKIPQTSSRGSARWPCNSEAVNPKCWRRAAGLAAGAGFDEINLNVGCPSSRVKAGRFGACLMHEPERVADCVRAMRGRAGGRPVTVKTRIGTNHRPRFGHLLEFARKMRGAGVAAVDRACPPSRCWKACHRRKTGTCRRCVTTPFTGSREALPDLRIVINGGVSGAAGIADHLKRVDGVMLGREAYANPWLLTGVAGRRRKRAFARPGAQSHGELRPARRISPACRWAPSPGTWRAFTRVSPAPAPGGGRWPGMRRAPAGEAHLLLDCAPEPMRHAA